MGGLPSLDVLVVDDDDAVGLVLVAMLTKAGHPAKHVSSSAEALRVLDARLPRVLVTDLRMPGMDGMALLREVRRRAPEVAVVMLTAHGNVETAVEAMKAGAADFMTKPFDREAVLFTIGKVLAAGSRRESLPPEPPRVDGPTLGVSEPMRECDGLVARAAKSLANVLVRGESGVGKEVVAREIHGRSLRSSQPFSVVHCAALPDNLLESELFGYAKGAFTGATTNKPGRVDVAAGGTLFLDEIGDVSPAVQVKLLRLVQEKEVQPLGAQLAHRVDVRIVAATHRNLEEAVREGRFREDLFYRLNVIPIWIPPLRERVVDVAGLANALLARCAGDAGRLGLRFDSAALARLAEHDWPGNVRELCNIVERLVVFSDDAVIGAEAVDLELARSSPPESRRSARLVDRRADAERDAVVEALRRAQGNRTQAARLLGVSRRTLYNRLSELGVDAADA
jgi:two-component system, NtrC family, response regulator AtoC